MPVSNAVYNGQPGATAKHMSKNKANYKINGNVVASVTSATSEASFDDDVLIIKTTASLSKGVKYTLEYDSFVAPPLKVGLSNISIYHYQLSCSDGSFDCKASSGAPTSLAGFTSPSMLTDVSGSIIHR